MHKSLTIILGFGIGLHMHRLHQWICLCGIITLNCAVAGTLESPRFSAYPGYTRLVFDAPVGTQYRVEPMGAALRVTFWDTQAQPGLVKVGKPELSGLTLANSGANTMVDIVTPQGVSDRRGFRLQQLVAAQGKTGYRLVLDFSGAFSDVSKLPSVAAPALEKTRGQNFTVLLDPGHGGTDPGARGNGLTESNLNLDVSFRIKKWLETAGVSVEMTRTDNRVYSKDKRTDLNARALASRGKTAFVSVHANARPPSNAMRTFGMEVYYFSPYKQTPMFITPAAAPGSLEALTAPITSQATAEPLTVGASESVSDSSLISHVTPSSAAMAAESTEVITSETTTTTTGDALETPDASTPLPADITQPSTVTPLAPLTTNLDRTSASKDLAANVLQHMLGATGAYNRGVLRGDYYVIRNAECPAILIEMGFVTHPVEAEQLKNPNYLDRISYGVAKGIVQYLENTQAVTLLDGGQRGQEVR
jgi:N-acetylmuramoyl-L-alanine amidase